MIANRENIMENNKTQKNELFIQINPIFKFKLDSISKTNLSASSFSCSNVLSNLFSSFELSKYLKLIPSKTTLVSMCEVGGQVEFVMSAMVGRRSIRELTLLVVCNGGCAVVSSGVIVKVRISNQLKVRIWAGCDYMLAICEIVLSGQGVLVSTGKQIHEKDYVTLQQTLC